MRVILILFFLPIYVAFSQDLAQFKITVEEDMVNSPVSMSLDGINYNRDEGDLVLYEVSPSGENRVASQLESNHSARLWFMLNDDHRAGSEVEYVLRLEKNPDATGSAISLDRDDKDIQLFVGEKPILKYRHSVMMPPEGADPIYKRSGFVHPLWSPGGEVLTRIQPPDHYHHYGIWGPWTKTHIGDREVDFWNLAKGLGTVRFSGFLSEVEGPVFSGFKVLQQHIDFGAAGPDQIAMNEILDIRAWSVEKGVWIIDYTTTLNSPLPDGIMLDTYRYGGGIGFRATEKWHKENCTVLTSAEKTRLDADGSFARWCIVEGESEVKEGRSGILFLSHPSNRKHPEPMRVWPVDANRGRGDMYFEFVPIRHDDWKLDPKQNYTLKYRMVVFDGKMDADTAEKYWNGFAKIPSIEITN